MPSKYSKTKAVSRRRLFFNAGNGKFYHILSLFFNGDGGFQVVPTCPRADAWTLGEILCDSAAHSFSTYPRNYRIRGDLEPGNPLKLHYHKSGLVEIRGQKEQANPVDVRQWKQSLTTLTNMQIFSYTILDWRRLPSFTSCEHVVKRGDLQVWTEKKPPHSTLHLAATYYSGKQARELMQSAKGTREGFYVKLNSKKTLPFFPLWPAGLEGGIIIHWTTDLRADRPDLTALSTLASGTWKRCSSEGESFIVATRGPGFPTLSVLNNRLVNIAHYSSDTSDMKIITRSWNKETSRRATEIKGEEIATAKDVAGIERDLS